MTVRAMAVGGFANGRYVEFPGGARHAYACEPPRALAMVSMEPIEPATFTMRRTLYTLEMVHFSAEPETRVLIAVAEGWTVRSALEHLLSEHRRVG